jgi:hypothetical protein
LTLQCNAYEPDGNPITYAWSATAGLFLGNSAGAVAIWQAPSAPGSATITCKVSDNVGASVSESTTEAYTLGTTPAVAHFSMSAQGKTAADGGILNLTAPDNGSVTVAFSSTSSQGSAAITTYIWKTNWTQICGNASSCNYSIRTGSNTVTLTVTDGNVNSSTATGQVNATFGTTSSPPAAPTLIAPGSGSAAGPRVSTTQRPRFCGIRTLEAASTTCISRRRPMGPPPKFTRTAQSAAG